MRTFFWGVFLISSGMFLILKHYFNWNVPAFRIIVGLFLLSLGLSLLFGGGIGYQGKNTIIFNDGRINLDINEKDYSVIFGQATFDFRENSIDELNGKLEVSTIFGSAEILLPKEATVEIEANSVFSSTQLPDGSNLSFGDRKYLSDPQGKKEADIVLEVNTVFGSTVIRH
jgi:hypothetical protein